MSDEETLALTAALAAPSPDFPQMTCAMACADCLAIFRAGATCPYCLSSSLLNLAAILSRQQEAPPC